MRINELIAHWEEVRAGLLTAIRKFSTQELDYVPFAGAYSVAQLILHIAHEEEGEVRYGITRELPVWPGEFTRSQCPSLEDMITLLTEVHQRTIDYLKTLQDAHFDLEITTPWGQKYTLANTFWHVIEHEIHHRGELSFILGLLGHKGLDA
jgi:uncharacterized damage-inducible protein DinB